MFVKVKDGSIEKYPYSIEEMRQDHSNVCFPANLTKEVMAEFGVYEVGYQSVSSYDQRTQYVEHSTSPSLVNDVYVLTTSIHSKNSDQLAKYDSALASQARNERNKLLSDTDWTQYKDIDETVSSRYTQYRQALRDLTSQSGFPLNITWPTKPE